MKRNVNEPNLIAETFVVMFRVFLIIYLATIVVVAVIYYKPTSPSRIGDARVEIKQVGNDNIHQEINN